MLKWALVLLVIALAAAVLGFGGIADSAATIGKILFVGFMVFAAIMAASGLATSRRLV